MPRKSSKEVDLTAAAAPAPKAKRAAAPKTAASTHKSATRTPVATAVPVVGTAAPAVVSAEPARDQVAQLAYFLWMERGCAPGHSEEDWYRAEVLLKTRAAGA